MCPVTDTSRVSRLPPVFLNRPIQGGAVPSAGVYSTVQFTVPVQKHRGEPEHTDKHSGPVQKQKKTGTRPSAAHHAQGNPRPCLGPHSGRLKPQGRPPEQPLPRPLPRPLPPRPLLPLPLPPLPSPPPLPLPRPRPKERKYRYSRYRYSQLKILFSICRQAFPCASSPTRVFPPRARP